MVNTTFKEEYVNKLKKCLMGKNGCIDKFCSDNDIPVRTVYGWMKLYPELVEAYDVGMAHARNNLVSELNSNLDNKDYNAYAWEKVYFKRFAKAYAFIWRYDKSKSRSFNALQIEEMICQHELDIDLGRKMLEAIETTCKIMHMDEIEERLCAMEEQMKLLANK